MAKERGKQRPDQEKAITTLSAHCTAHTITTDSDLAAPSPRDRGQHNEDGDVRGARQSLPIPVR